MSFKIKIPLTLFIFLLLYIFLLLIIFILFEIKVSNHLINLLLKTNTKYTKYYSFFSIHLENYTYHKLLLYHSQIMLI